MRWAEAGLFLAPFLLYAIWWLAAARARPAIVWGSAAVVLMLAVVTVWLGLARSLDRGYQYVPARLEGGQIVAGHGVRPNGP